MKEEMNKNLCVNLMKADSEEEVIKLLSEAGYWGRKEVWRFYGDYETNYNTIGNQQSKPDAALVEKLVNSVDARLMNECYVNGIDPEANHAPQTIREAVAMFFDHSKYIKSSLAGRIKEWPVAKRTEISKEITVVSSGPKPPGNMCITISDSGEGQTPERMPETFLSLTKSNKFRIPFVQGRFNMGGTGVLKFCGKNNLELILSRRNPSILKGIFKHSTDDQWGFTIIRREAPEGKERNSTYTYLAPVEVNGNHGKGGVLRFNSETMPIFPEGREPYKRVAGWGTLIKLYNYVAPGYKSHILMKDGILGRIDLLLPDVALPSRFYECREYGGHEGSFETTLTGLRVRLEDDKGKNLENDFPSSASINVLGEEMTVTIYAFKKGAASTYRKNEGIIFVSNGQTHGHLTNDFYSRKKVGLSYLSDSILVIVDCSKLSGLARENLFMNSRDRLSSGELRTEIEKALEDLLKTHDGLRALKERRRRQEIEAKLDDSKPLENILESLLKRSPTLSALFLHGLRVSTPFKTLQVQSQEVEYKGKTFPTYFNFKGKNYGFIMVKDCHINMRCRITFETDAENNYFRRDADPGEFHLYTIQDEIRIPVGNHVLNLQNGIATLSLTLPSHITVGQEIEFNAAVNDPSQVNPFENNFIVHVKEAAETKVKPTDGRRKPPGEKKGEERDIPSGIQLPHIVLVQESDWANHTPPFDAYSALQIKNAGEQEAGDNNGSGQEVYDFYINMDNIYLKSELKSGSTDPEINRARFKYGLVLLGLAILQQDLQEKKRTDAEDRDEEFEDRKENIEDKVDAFSKAIAPVLIPMIVSLGDLELEDGFVKETSGEAT